MRTTTPRITDTAVAASFLKSKMNGAAIRSAAARYSMIPWTYAGMGPCRNTAWTLSEEHLGRLEQARIEELGLRERLVERHELDLRPPQRDHLAEVARVGGVDRRDAEARPQHAVVGERRPPALDVAEDRHAR